MTNKLVIDDSFMEKWCPKYDCLNVGADEVEFKQIINDVEEDVSKIGTLSLELFKKIYNWKAARAIHHVDFSKFDDYRNVFKQATVDALKFPDRIIEEFDNLPGIGIPVASTILHFIYHKDFPIVDFRTIEVLQEANNLGKSMEHYRDTSKALFAYHKLCFNSQNKN